MVNGLNQNPYPQYPYNQRNFGAVPQAATPVGEQVQDSPVGSVASDLPTDPKEIIKSVPYYAAGIGGGWAIGKGLNKLCNTNGAYKDSRLVKISSWIDEKVPGLKNANTKVDGWIKSAKTKLLSIYNHEKFPKTLKQLGNSIKNGAEPVNQMAKSQYHGVKGMAADTFVGELRKAVKEGKVTNLPDKLKTILNNESSVGIKVIEDLEKGLGKDGLANLVKSANILETPRSFKLFFNKFGPEIKLGTKKLNLNASLNKYKGLAGEGTNTFLSRALQKGTLIAGEATTGSVVGGGAFGMLLNAFFLGGSIKKAAEAPKGEKLSTFMEEFMGNYFGFLITMPIAEKVLYKALGVSKLGMDKKVTTELLNKHSKLADKIKLADKNSTIEENIAKLSKDLVGKTRQDSKAIRTEISALKKLSSKETPGILKLFKKVGSFFSAGLGKDAAKEAMKGKGILSAGNFIKRWGGGGMRFAIISFALAPILTKPFTALSHAIFGTPTATKKEQEEKKAKKNGTKQDENDQQNNTQVNQTTPVVAQNTAQTTAAPVATAPAAQQRYIPSAEPAVFQPQVNSAIQNELNKSDTMLNYLNGVLKSSH